MGLPRPGSTSGRCRLALLHHQESDPTEGFQEQEGYRQAEAALAGATADGGYDEIAGDEEVPF